MTMTSTKTQQELWARYFDCEFPLAATYFWKHYSPGAIDRAFEALQRKSQTEKFPSMADACKYATGCMKSAEAVLRLNDVPAPVPAPEVKNVKPRRESVFAEPANIDSIAIDDGEVEHG